MSQCLLASCSVSHAHPSHCSHTVVVVVVDVVDVVDVVVVVGDWWSIGSGGEVE